MTKGVKREPRLDTAADSSPLNQASGSTALHKETAIGDRRLTLIIYILLIDVVVLSQFDPPLARDVSLAWSVVGVSVLFLVSSLLELYVRAPSADEILITTFDFVVITTIQVVLIITGVGTSMADRLSEALRISLSDAHLGIILTIAGTVSILEIATRPMRSTIFDQQTTRNTLSPLAEQAVHEFLVGPASGSASWRLVVTLANRGLPYVPSIALYLLRGTRPIPEWSIIVAMVFGVIWANWYYISIGVLTAIERPERARFYRRVDSILSLCTFTMLSVGVMYSLGVPDVISRYVSASIVPLSRSVVNLIAGLITWLLGAVATGIVGNAAYDLLKRGITRIARSPANQVKIAESDAPVKDTGSQKRKSRRRRARS